VATRIEMDTPRLIFTNKRMPLLLLLLLLLLQQKKRKNKQKKKEALPWVAGVKSPSWLRSTIWRLLVV
jgi:hypothetical protein